LRQKWLSTGGKRNERGECTLGTWIRQFITDQNISMRTSQNQYCPYHDSGMRLAGTWSKKLLLIDS
jgi:hypothetical protein